MVPTAFDKQPGIVSGGSRSSAVKSVVFNLDSRRLHNVSSVLPTVG